ncbi:MAG TPA: GNAT family N-acetyltransferase [Bradyrhizobium sp.]|nr:GNAT family N-acetyltransferase [Bradyrhizobium sp.]
MTMAAAIESRTADVPAWSKTSRIAKVDFLDDLGQAEAIWRGPEDHRHLNDCPLMTIAPNASPTARVGHSLRQRFKAKERKLKVLPGYRYHVATEDADIARLLDAFFRIKPQRMAELIPLSPRGAIVAAAMSGFNRAKYLVKRSPALLNIAEGMRRALR